MISDAERVLVKGAGGIMGSLLLSRGGGKSSDLLQGWMRSLLQGDKLFDPIDTNAQQTGSSFLVVQVCNIGVNRYDINTESAIKYSKPCVF